MNRSAWQFDLLPELGELASQLAHPMHDRLAAGSEPAACEADRVTQLAEGSVIVEGFGRTGLPDFFERSVNVSELLEYADVGVLVRPWLGMIDELLNLSPTISDPQDVAAHSWDRPSDADLRPLKPLPQAPQSRHPAASGPGPMNPEDNRRLRVYLHVEVEPTADVCPSGPAATRSIRAETAGSSGLALGPNQRGKAGGGVEASIPVMATARQRTRRRVRRRTHPPRRGSIVPRMCRTVRPRRVYGVTPLRSVCDPPFEDPTGQSESGCYTAQAATVTRRNVAGMEVTCSLWLAFWALKRASSSACSSPSPPRPAAASNAFIVGP